MDPLVASLLVASLLAALAPALAMTLLEVGKELVSRALLSRASRQLVAPLLQDDDIKVRDASVHKALEATVEESGLVEWVAGGDYRLVSALDRLAGKDREALRERVVATAMVMTGHDPEQVSLDLLRAMDLPEDQRANLAHFLWRFREELAMVDEDYRALFELARHDAVRNYLRVLASTLVRTPNGSAHRTAMVEPEVSVDELQAQWIGYMNHLINTYRMLSFRGIVQAKNSVELPLAQVYVSLGVTPVGGEDAEPREVTDNIVLRARQERAERLRVEHVLRREPRLVVLGDPGGGKTTFLRYVALAMARGAEAEQEPLLSESRVPIYLPLAAYKEELKVRWVSLEDYVLHYWRTRGFDQPGMERLVVRTLQAGRVLLLLDGLDEVGSRSDRMTIARQVEAWTNSYGPLGNRVVVTSRIVGYDEVPLAGGFRAYALSPLGPKEIERFAFQWCVAYQRWVNRQEPDQTAIEKGRTEAARLVGEISADPKVEILASNPLLITIITLLHCRGTRLPDHRVELYDLCIQTLVETWREARSEAGPVGKPLRVANEIKVLAPFALWLQEQAPGPAGVARRDAVRAYLLDLITRELGGGREAAEAEVDLFLELGQKQTGLLVERGGGWFGFSHPTFREYLAARACVLEGQIKGAAGTWAALRSHLSDASWHEVILLTVGYKAIIESQDEAATYLVRQVAAGSGNPDENVVLAGRCLADIGRGLVADDCWAEIVEKMLYIMQDLDSAGCPSAPPRVSIATRHAAAETLDRLGWLPDAVNAWVAVEISGAKPRPPDRIYVGQYPVTNAQFALFVAAGGYEAQGSRWWSEEGWKWREGGERRWSDKGIDQPEYWDHPRLGKRRPGYPVVGVSWYEATAYCAWLAELLGRLRDGEALKRDQRALVEGLVETAASDVRLPTEQEWVAAADGEEANRYPWGTEWHESHANTAEGGVSGTTPVGMYPSGRSPCGGWDMAGNVWEWMASWHGDRDGYCFLRGGSWSGHRDVARVAVRLRRSPDFSDDYLGFRAVASLARSGP